MSKALAGKVAIVTGGGSGIGAASARGLAAEGASVVVADIDADGARSVAAEITRAGGIAAASHTDLGDLRQVRAMIDTALGAFGGLDVLFNNAAALNVRNQDYDVADVDLDVWALQLRVNLTAPLAASKFAIPHMIRRGGGVILHTGSAAGILGDSTRTGYAATKAALAGLSRAIAVQYGKKNIRSNVIAPGQVLSPFALRTFGEEEKQLYLDAHLTPRVGVPEDIAAAVVFLASDRAAFITGQIIPVDGGFTSQLPVVPGMRRLRGS